MRAIRSAPGSARPTLLSGSGSPPAPCGNGSRVDVSRKLRPGYCCWTQTPPASSGAASLTSSAPGSLRCHSTHCVGGTLGSSAQARRPDGHRRGGRAGIHELPQRAPGQDPQHQSLEGLNGEIKRRTDVVGIFPNEAAVAPPTSLPVQYRSYLQCVRGLLSLTVWTLVATRLFPFSSNQRVSRLIPRTLEAHTNRVFKYLV